MGFGRKLAVIVAKMKPIPTLAIPLKGGGNLMHISTEIFTYR